MPPPTAALPLFAGSTLTINTSRIINNAAADTVNPAFFGGGGGISGSNTGLTININNSEISGNNTTGTNGNSGGGIDTAGTLNVTNTTVSGNSATALNSSGGGIRINVNTNTVTLDNTLIANSTGGDCVRNSGTVNATYSLIESGLTCVNGTNTNNLTGDPNLSPLQNNGGRTLTHAPLAGSIVIDQGNSATPFYEQLGGAPFATDQRGARRPFDIASIPNAPDGNGADIGAVEFITPTASSVTVGGRVTNGTRGINGAAVLMNLPDGTVRQTRTNPFGYFRFDGVEAGQTVLLNAYHKRFQFEPQVIAISGETVNIEIVPQSNGLEKN